MFAWFSDLNQRERSTMVACFGGWSLDLGNAIFVFTIGGLGLMIIALLLLPETRGRSLASLEATG